MKNQSLASKLSFRIHFAFFDPNLPKKAYRLLNNQAVSSVLSSEFWWIQTQNFINQSWHSIFQFMTSTLCSQLWLRFNDFESIIMSISKTNFEKLKQLGLPGGNKVNSIEQLEFINMPFLEVLSLVYYKQADNKITRTSGMKKCKWQNLKCLCLEGNPIEQIEITRFQMRSSDCLNAQYSADQNNGHNYVSMWAKVNFNKIELFQCAKGIPPQQRQLQCLKEKGINIDYR